MGGKRILVSPAQYDDVGVVLKQLGGEFADFQQLQPEEMDRLEDVSFLSQFRLVFLNCHRSFRAANKQHIIASIRHFVERGGVLYASDWASTIVAAAFGGKIQFNHRAGEEGVVNARVDDIHLVHVLGTSIPIHFDMGQWDVIQTPYRGEDVYLWDEARRPIAVGFEAGQGSVIFTSFHHHAQKDSSDETSEFEQTLLKWLVLLTTQQHHLSHARELLTRYRSFGTGWTLRQLGNDRDAIPLKDTSKPGLGVFNLFWEHNSNLELSMRYLRSGELVEMEKSSNISPLTIAVRNPRPVDVIEIGRKVLDAALGLQEETISYVFSTSVRRDLLDNSSWFALSILRQLRAALEDADNSIIIHEHVTETLLKKIIENILSGLGYQLGQKLKEHENDQLRTVHATSIDNAVSPNIQIEFRISVEAEDREDESEGELPGVSLNEIPPSYENVDDGTEYVFASLAFVLKRNAVSGTNDRQLVESQIKDTNWTIVDLEVLPTDLLWGSSGAREQSQEQDLRIIVYKLYEEGNSQV